MEARMKRPHLARKGQRSGHWFGRTTWHHLRLRALMIWTNLSGTLLQSVLCLFCSKQTALLKPPESLKGPCVISSSLRNTMNPVAASVIFALLGLLVPEIACQEPKTPEEEVAFLKVRLDLMKDRYRLLCNQYANMADNCSAPAITCTECPAGWLQVGDQCFHMSTDRHNFSSSAEKCRETGAQLAMLTTREQHDAVEKEGRRIAGFHIYYWIGLSDSVTEGDWRWMDNSPLKTSFWSVHRSEPDNNQSQGPEGEDCAVVDSYTQSWYDVPCEFEYPRVCQKAATPLL